jgi:methionine salvage enolase-phosphatase E1
MITFGGKLILLDIEGTVSPLAFVHDVMFPYARQHAGTYLGMHWKTASAVNMPAFRAAFNSSTTSLMKRICSAGRSQSAAIAL